MGLIGKFVPNNVKAVKIDSTFAGAGTNELVAAPGAGMRIVLHGYVITTSADIDARINSAATVKAGPFDLGVNAGVSCPFSEQPWVECAANEALNLQAAAAGHAGGHLLYSVEPITT